MGTFAETIKRILARFRQADFEFVTHNWSVLRSLNFDVAASGRAKTKFISALLDRIKVLLVFITV